MLFLNDLKLCERDIKTLLMSEKLSDILRKMDIRPLRVLKI